MTEVIDFAKNILLIAPIKTTEMKRINLTKALLIVGTAYFLVITLIGIMR